MLDPKEYERLKKLYSSLDDERLLDLIRNQRKDFSPETLFLIQSELTSRGFRNEDFAVPESPVEKIPAEAAAPEEFENWVPVADCPDEFIAGQVQDILGQNCIPSAALRGNVGAEPIVSELAWPGGRIVIAVAPFDVERAKEILDDLPPLDEGVVTVLDSPDGQEGENSEEDK